MKSLSSNSNSIVIRRGWDVETVATEADLSNLFEVLTRCPKAKRVSPSRFHLKPLVLTPGQGAPRGIKPQWSLSKRFPSSLGRYSNQFSYCLTMCGYNAARSTKPCLCSKLPLFKKYWWMLRVLPHLVLLTHLYHIWELSNEVLYNPFS